MIRKATATQPAENQHGALIIKTTLFPTHIGFDVNTGAGQVRELCKTFDNREQAAAYYRHVSQSAEAGTPIHRIVAEVQVLQEAQLAANINASMDEATAAYLAPREQARQVAADALRNSKGWDRFADRRNVNTRPTCTDPLTPVMQRAIDHADINGIIHVGPGIALTTIEGLARRGLGRRIYGKRRYQVVGIQLHTAKEAA